MTKKVNVTIKYVPHPNPEAVINLFAELVLKEVPVREGGGNKKVTQLG